MAELACVGPGPHPGTSEHAGLTTGRSAFFSLIFKNRSKRRRRPMIRKYALACFLAVLGFLLVRPLSHTQEQNKTMGCECTVAGLRCIEEGQPAVMINATVQDRTRC